MYPDELEEREHRYRAQFRAYTVVRRMRWVTLVFGPVPLLWDNVLWPILQAMGVPPIMTMEDIMRMLILTVLPIDVETFERLWPHVVNISTVLFVVFVVWTVKKQRTARAAARQVAEVEDRMVLGGYRER